MHLQYLLAPFPPSPIHVLYLNFLNMQKTEKVFEQFIKYDLEQNLFNLNDGFSNHLMVLSVSIKVWLVG